jgi:hypothetical protein
MVISSLENAVILGTILGDGHLQRSLSKSGKSRLRIGHSFKQKAYVDWKRSALGRLCETTQPPKKVEQRGYEQYLFYTQYRDDLTYYHKIFYTREESKSRKIVPENIEKILTDPISLVVWYLDDGTLRNDCDACRLATQSLTLEEVNLLRKCLANNLSIASRLDIWLKGSCKMYGISIPARDFKIFRS